MGRGHQHGAGSGILLTDADLFPPGCVSLNGIKVFGDFSVDKVVSATATLIRDSGSGLDKIFHDLLRSQGCVYRRAQDLCCYEGGAGALIRGEQVLVGSSAFMHLMDVELPQGLNVKNAVFCALDGELAGIFALNYSLHGLIEPSLNALIRNRITPVLATRDFNLIPAMLRQRFKLPVEKMEFPAVERRRELSGSGAVPQRYPDRRPLPGGPGALFGGSGGGRPAAPGRALLRGARLRRRGCRRAAGLLSHLRGGLLLASPSNLLVFLFMWLVPTPLISGWVDRY